MNYISIIIIIIFILLIIIVIKRLNKSLEHNHSEYHKYGFLGHYYSLYDECKLENESSTTGGADSDGGE